MNFKKITPSTRRLFFDCQKKFPKLMPAILAHDVLLWGPDGEILEALDATSHMSLEEILSDLFAPIGFMDFIFLQDSLVQAQLPFDPKRLAHTFQLDWEREVEPLAEKIRSLPEEIKLWLRNRKFNASHLAPLRALDWDESFVAQWRQLTRVGSTHTEAVLALEYLVDLRLLGRDVNSIFSSSPKSMTLMLDELRQLRFPMDAKRSTTINRWVETLPWAKRMQVRPTRQNDRSGLEVKFFTHNSEDLKKNIGSLMDVAKTLEQKNIERF